MVYLPQSGVTEGDKKPSKFIKNLYLTKYSLYRHTESLTIEHVRATLPLQFLVLKSGSSGSRTIHTRDNPHKG